MVPLLQKLEQSTDGADADAAPPTLAWNLPHTCIFQSDIVGRGLPLVHFSAQPEPFPSPTTDGPCPGYPTESAHVELIMWTSVRP